MLKSIVVILISTLFSLAFGAAAVSEDNPGAAMGVSRDVKLLELRLQAEAGDRVAPYELGLMYANGAGVPRDHVRAYAWFDAAASLDVEGGRTACRQLE